MDKALINYIASLIPRDFPDGRELVKEGYALGQTLPVGRSKFLEKFGYKNYLEYRKDYAAKGKITWQLLLGLATKEEEIEGIKELEAYSERTGLDIWAVQSIPSMLVGLPYEYWEKAPKPTSYTMHGLQDWMDHAEAAAIQIIWQDWHLSCPNNLETTIHAIRSGSPRLGTFSQFIWDYPNYTDELKRYSDMVRSLGILASKREHFITADTYAEDGYCGYFFDVASYVGYTLVEHHIIEKLCGAKMSISYGGLLTDIQPRMAYGMAMHKLLGSEEEPILSYFNGGTLEQWDHDIQANFGTGVQEMLIQILVELKYKMMATISPVSITERLRVPTLQELFDIASAGKRAEEKAPEWLPLMDFTPLEQMRDLMIEKGLLFFDNVMNAFKAAGVDTEDPLQMIVVLKRFNSVTFEQSFHPSTQDGGAFEAYVPSVLGHNTLDQGAQIVADLNRKGYRDALQGKKIIVVSADGHSYGLMLVDHILNELKAHVINGGVDMYPVDVLDLADEEGTSIIMVSAHIGQILDYSRQITELARRRGRTYHIFAGGMLNALPPGYTEPIDVTDQVRELGVYATNDLLEAVEFIRKIR
jgi:methylmalonyl-CoA mutase cobalamin-binding subunit